MTRKRIALTILWQDVCTSDSSVHSSVCHTVCVKAEVESSPTTTRDLTQPDTTNKTRKLCYRKDDRAMRTI